MHFVDSEVTSLTIQRTNFILQSHVITSVPLSLPTELHTFIPKSSIIRTQQMWMHSNFHLLHNLLHFL